MRVNCHVGGCCALFMQWGEVTRHSAGLECHGGQYCMCRFDIGLVLCNAHPYGKK